jgi:hypothetical protein
MLRFFRNLRRNNTGESDLRTYAWYAIGEIILVITGILIALQINNWNEQRKDREIVESILSGIKDDMLSDIREARAIIAWYDQREFVIADMLDEEVDPEYEQFIYTAGMFWYPFVLNKDSFEALNANKDKVPIEYQELIKRLNSLYIQTDALLETRQKYIDEHLSQYRLHLVHNEEWYINYSQDTYTDEITEYFLKSNFHKRQLLRFTDLSESMTSSLNEVIRKSIYNYVVLHNLLTPYEEYPSYLGLADLELSNQKLRGVEGTYFEEIYQTEIKLTPNLVDSEPYLLVDLPGDTLGSMIDDSYLVIERDERSRVTGITIRQPNGITSFLPKIE